jgi:hypothetical protein
VVEEDGVLIGGAPAMVERRAALHWIHLMPFALPGTPLAVAGQHALVDRLVADALERRAQALHAVGGAWFAWRPAGPEIEPAALERLAGETRTTSTSVVDLTRGTEAAWRGLERDTRSMVRAARAGGLEVREDSGALDEAYALYQGQARAWPGHRLRPLVLLRRLLDGDPPAARLYTVRDGRGLLAAALALVGEWEWMPWWSGAHPDSRRRHAYVLLMWTLVEEAAAAGCRRLNLGGSAGVEAVAVFKHRLGAGDQRVPVRWIGPDHAGPVGRAVAALQNRLRRGRPRGAPA